MEAAEQKAISLVAWLNRKAVADGLDYDYTVTAGGTSGLTLHVYQINEDSRKEMFSGPMSLRDQKDQ